MVAFFSEAGPLLAIATAFLLLAGLAKSAVDIMSHQEDNNIFMNWGGWFDNRTSWKRKYKSYDTGDLRPRFPGAKTLLVCFIDFWHAADFVYLKAYLIGSACGGIGIYRAGGSWLAYAGFVLWASIAIGAVFEVTYRRFFRIKKVD